MFPRALLLRNGLALLMAASLVFGFGCGDPTTSPSISGNDLGGTDPAGEDAASLGDDAGPSELDAETGTDTASPDGGATGGGDDAGGPSPGDVAEGVSDAAPEIDDAVEDTLGEADASTSMDGVGGSELPAPDDVQAPDDAGPAPEDVSAPEDITTPEGGWPGACCDVDGDCLPDLACYHSDPDDLGVCVVPATDGHCYGDDQCEVDEVCVNAQAAPCSAGVSAAPWPGDCEAPPVDPGACCQGDVECSDGLICLDPYAGWAEQPGIWSGTCGAPLESGECYSDEDCLPAELCGGASVPECWVDEGSAPEAGICAAPGGFAAGECCSQEGECAAGLVCLDPWTQAPVNGFIAWSGVCGEPAGPGECYATEDCEAGWTCEGALLGECWNMPDLGPPTPGECTWPGAGVGECCWWEADCADGLQCRFADGAVGGGFCPGPGPTGTCVPAPLGDGCYDLTDCPAGDACEGAYVPMCWELEAANLVTTGQCTTPPGGEGACCFSASECQPGLECLDPLTTLPITFKVAWSGTCGQAPEAGQCWEEADCDDAEVCSGAYVPWCWDVEFKGNPVPGTCFGVDPGGCCSQDLDCGPGKVCVSAGFGAAAPGMCFDEASAGWCWEDADCGASQACHGAAACPCGWDCDMAYEGPGVCVDQPTTGCVPVDETWVLEICNAASVVIFDGEKCLHTCPGCCGCEPFCDLTFESIEACEGSCPASTSP